MVIFERIVARVKLHERLGIGVDFVGLEMGLQMLQHAERTQKTDGYEIAWNKFERVHSQELVALKYYLLDDHQAVERHARTCIKEAEEFFLGSWRSEFKTPEGRQDARWWKEKFIWMEIFKACLLWGSVLEEWDVLKRISSFPDENACISDGSKPQERDALVAIASVLRGDAHDKSSRYLDRAATGTKKGCKLLADTLHKLIAVDANGFEKALAAYLQNYKKTDFPKENITKKISIEGTCLVHWGRHQGLKMQVPSQLEDYIVKLRL